MRVDFFDQLDLPGAGPLLQTGRASQPHPHSTPASASTSIVERTPISFEEIAPSPAEIADRIARLAGSLPWLVAEREPSGVIGYAYASPHRERAAYRWSVDVSAYVDAAARRIGIATALYRALIRLLDAQGYHRAFAGITLPNDASVGLHRALGFEQVGVYREAGYKLGAWRDTSWWQRPIGISLPTPSEPVTVSALDREFLDRACREVLV